MATLPLLKLWRGGKSRQQEAKDGAQAPTGQPLVAYLRKQTSTGFELTKLESHRDEQLPSPRRVWQMVKRDNPLCCNLRLTRYTRFPEVSKIEGVR